jgi:hypothetical protein
LHLSGCAMPVNEEREHHAVPGHDVITEGLEAIEGDRRVAEQAAKLVR